MASIEVSGDRSGHGWVFRVRVSEGGGATEHTVRLSEPEWERFTGQAAPPEGLVEESFRFLLEREPKESILREFELPVIARYFPEYPEEIRRRVGAERGAE